MINLFKKQVEQNLPVVQTITSKNMDALIDEIHETFFTEVDKLLTDAKIAKSLDTDKQGLIDKCDRLKSLGFTSTKEVKEAESEIKRLIELKKENEVKKELIEAINYFSFKYPNYNFITEESVKKICEKYGLVYGEINRYLGTVPDKNLIQMEQFKIDSKDELYIYKESYTFIGFGGGQRDIKVDNFTEQEYNLFKNNEEQIINNLHDRYKGVMSDRVYFSITCEKLPLEIAAPVKDFNMEGKRVIDSKISDIPDPVVLKPVIFNKQKFYLIVTAWGKEAADELVVNPKSN